MIFGIVVNVAFFLSWYRIVSQQPRIPPSRDQSKSQNNNPKTQHPKWMNRLSRRPLIGMQEPLIITDQIFLNELQEYEWWMHFINYQDQIWYYDMDDNHAVLISVDPLVDSQLILIYITITAALVLAIISYWVSMIIVRRWLKPLYSLVDHIHQTQDPEQYEHLVVWPDQDELQQVSSALTHAMDTIARQTHNLKQFVTHASHELKTPLMTISSSVDLMIRSGISHPQTQTIKKTTSSMKSLIDRLMSTMRHDIIQTQQLDMGTMIHDIVDHVGTSYDHCYKLNLSIAEHLIKYADPMICESIITNLVDNAHKYAVPGTTIQVISDIKQFIISNHVDSGDIIDLDLIREPFYQWDVSQTDTHSHGLGLSIVKQYVERMGWKIKAKIEYDIIFFTISW